LIFFLKPATAQIADKLVPHTGFMLEFVNQQTADSQFLGADLEALAFYTFHIGTYYVLAHHNDILSAGLDGGLNFGLNFNSFNVSQINVNLLIQPHLMMMGRLGANSTPYNEQKVGLGAGVGMNYTFLSTIIGEPFNGGFVDIYKEKIDFFNPFVMIEGSLNSRGGSITGRAQIGLANFLTTGKFESQVFNEPSFKAKVRPANWGLGIIYSF
jgi:hypothetical protein